MKNASWENWINVVLGIWILLSPWIFGYAGETVPFWNAFVTGLTAAGVSAAALPIARSRRGQS
jgi:hypothetical protein